MQRIFLFISVFFISCFSFGQVTIIGKWKLVKVSYIDHFTKSVNTIYEVGKSDSIKKELLRIYSTQKNQDSGFINIDTVAFKAKLNRDFKNYQLANLQFKKASIFIMKSFGLIIPSSQPGWHFADLLSGNWASTKTTLKLTLGNKEIENTFFYKIIELSKNRLIIGQTGDDYAEHFNEITFVRL